MYIRHPINLSCLLIMCVLAQVANGQFGPPGPTPREERTDDATASVAKRAHDENGISDVSFEAMSAIVSLTPRLVPIACAIS